jgi:hypothetical protein
MNDLEDVLRVDGDMHSRTAAVLKLISLHIL